MAFARQVTATVPPVIANVAVLATLAVPVLAGFGGREDAEPFAFDGPGETVRPFVEPDVVRRGTGDEVSDGVGVTAGVGVLPGLRVTDGVAPCPDAAAGSKPVTSAGESIVS